jgi:hypothetical protein
VHQLALHKLSPSDRELVQQVRILGARDLRERFPTVESRWEAALASAIAETGYPIQLLAWDHLL